jgi:transketolase
MNELEYFMTREPEVRRNPALGTPPLAELKRRAHEIRQNCVQMSMNKGEGYIGQVLGISDLLAALYFYEMQYDPEHPEWALRDRFILSTGHYSSAMWAVLAAAGVLEKSELADYALNGSRLAMSTYDDVPGIEFTAGSLGMGLGVAVGQAMGLRLDGEGSRVFVEISDGELQEGSTWEAAMSAKTFDLDNLVLFVDCNGVQADGPVKVAIEPVANKFRAFGWDTTEIDGNDMAAICAALVRARAADGQPKAIILRTIPGKGIPSLEVRERKHFMRVGKDEWARLSKELEDTFDG